MSDGKKDILIVDDEIRIGRLIEKLIHWDELGMTCLSVEDDPEHALEIIRTHHPDIVITDVRMPRLSGLDLVRTVKEEGINCTFLMISGYRDFEYAHQALQYEVDGYLLKPANEKELNDTLRKVSGKMDLEVERQIRTDRLEKAVSESRRIINRNFLKRILDQESDDGIDTEGVSLSGDCFQALDIKLDTCTLDHYDPKQDEETLSRIHTVLEEVLGNTVPEYLVCEKEYLHIYVLLSFPEESARTVRVSINKILSDIQDYLLKYEQFEVTIGVGSERSRFSDIRFSVQESNRCVNNRLRQGTGRLIYANSIPPKSESGSLSEEEQSAFSAAVESYSMERVDQELNNIFLKMAGEGKDCSPCYELWEFLAASLQEHTNAREEVFAPVRERLCRLSQNCRTIGQMKQFFRSEIEAWLMQQKQAAESESSRPIRQAKQYIDQHYAEKIILEDLADVVGLNPVYFSVLFKEKTGMNFTAYLLSVRMEKAKQMLVETNETISAIGESVGYKDSRYFSQTFARAVGVKPALYRRLHS